MSDPYDNYASNHLLRISGARTRLHKQQAFLENYRHLLPADRDSRILELGPGLGEIASLLVDQLGYRQYAAIDIASDVVELFRDRPAYRVSQVDDPVSHLQAQPGGHDLIILLHVLEHVPRPRVVPLLTAIHEALAPGGQVIIEVPNAANAVIGGGYAFGDFTHETAFTSTSLRQVLGSAGFVDPLLLPVRVPRVSAARWIQHLLQRLLNGLQSVLAKIYMPSGTPLFSHLIAGVASKRRS